MNQLPELIARANGTFVPQSLADFIGQSVTERGSGANRRVTCGAHVIAAHLEKCVQLARDAGNSPLKFLINGPPGLGKSTLALYLQRLLGCNKWSTTRLNGTQVKLEIVEELAAQLHYKSLFSEYRMVVIDEADRIPNVAQVRFLTLLDELPDAAAVVCTSNCKVSDFEPRFQTRFQVFELEGPPPGEIEALLRRFVPGVRCEGSGAEGQEIKMIAAMCCGNVRAALLDVLGIVQQGTALKLAA